MKGKWYHQAEWAKRLGIVLLVYVSLVPAAGSSHMKWNYSIKGITALSVSENGYFLAVGCEDGFYYIFDSEGNLLGSGNAPSAIGSLDIADTGDLIIGSAVGYTFCTKYGVHISSFLSSPVKNISLSSDGIFSLVCCQGNLFVNRRDSMIYQLEVSSDSPLGAISSDGSLACAASDSSLHIFRNGNFQESLKLDEKINSLFVSENGEKIIFSTESGKIGYIESGELQSKDISSSITSMASCLSGDTILLSTSDKLIWLKEDLIVKDLPVDDVHCFSLSRDGSLAAIKTEDKIFQLISSDGTCILNYDCETRIVASEISGSLVAVCTDSSISVFQLFQKTYSDQFTPASSRKSLPLTSSLEEIWSIPVEENAAFLAADIDGDGLTEVVLKEGTLLKLIDRNGNQKSVRDLEIPFTLISPLDIDGDTIPEIPIIFEYSMFLFSTYDWNERSIKDYNLDSLRENLSQIGKSVPFAALDIDGDGEIEILASVAAGYSCKPRGVVALDYVSGDLEWFYQIGPSVNAGSVEDIDGDGKTDIVVGSVAPCNCEDDEKFPDCEIYIFALSNTGEEIWKTYLGKGFRRVEIRTDDVDEHEGIEVIGFGYEASENWGRLCVLNYSGDFLYDLEVDYSIFPGVAGDIDGDGNKEIVVVDSRGYISIYTYDLYKKSERFINESISSRSQLYLNDINGDGNCEIILGFDNELHILDKNLEDIWKREFRNEIRILLTYFSGCKNTLLVLSDRLYAFSYQDTGELSCPLWVITERNLLEEASRYIDVAESSFAEGEHTVSKQYFERALTIFYQLEDQKEITALSNKIAEVSIIIFKHTLRMIIVLVAVLDGILCVVILYQWVTRKKWNRLAEGNLLLSLPLLLGLFQVYYADSQQYIIVFARYFIPSFILSVFALLRQSIIGFVKTILALVNGHKDMLVLSVVKSDGSYKVSVESIEEKFRPVKESRRVVFPQETKEELIRKTNLMTGVLSQFSLTRTQEKSISYAEEVLRNVGGVIYQNFIPEDFSDILKAKFLLLEVEDPDIPWELMCDDDFFAVKYAISRRVVTTDKVITRLKQTRGKRALVISDPLENLPGAQTECSIVYRRLKQKMETILVEGNDATMKKVANLFGQEFDIIHFAGHVEEGLLLLSDGVMTPEEVKEFMAGTPVVVVNGCKSEDLAKAFLLGGAMAYIGTIHPIHDGSAADIAADFYDFCLQYRIGEALRRARELHMGKDLVWASLVMYGDPTLKLL